MENFLYKESTKHTINQPESSPMEGIQYLTQIYIFPLSKFPCPKAHVISIVPAKALMPTMLVQEHEDKTITHTVHEVLTWFGQPCLRPRMRDNDSTIQ